MANAVGYRLRISQNPYFSSTIVDRKVSTADVMVSGLGEGAYYWMVQSYDASGKESVESEKNRFTIIPKGKRHDRHRSGPRSVHAARARDRIDGTNRGRGARHGERQGSAGGRRGR